MNQISLNEDVDNSLSVQQLLTMVVKESVDTNRDARESKLASIRDVHLKKEQAIEERVKGQQAGMKGLFASLSLGLFGAVAGAATAVLPASNKVMSAFNKDIDFRGITSSNAGTAQTLKQKVADWFIKKLIPDEDLVKKIFSNIDAADRQKILQKNLFKQIGLNLVPSSGNFLSQQLSPIGQGFADNAAKAFESVAARYDTEAERANAEAEKAQVRSDSTKDTSSAAMSALSAINTAEADSIKQIVRA